MVVAPGDYPRSSYRAPCRRREPTCSSPITALSLALGASVAERQAGYRALFAEALREDWIAGLRAATNGGWAFGAERLKEQLAAAARRRVTPLPKGRPRDDEFPTRN